jgi:hypothetical protein
MASPFALAGPRILSIARPCYFKSRHADLDRSRRSRFRRAWRSDEASGFARIIPTAPGTKGLDVTAAVIAADAKDCKGKFALARKSELIDSEVVFQGMVSREDSDGTMLSNYFILPRAKGGFVMFSVISNMKSSRP